MAKFKKPCLVCGSLTTNASRCDVHQAEIRRIRDAKYNTPEKLAKKRLMYGGDYQQRRKQVLANATHCSICNEPLRPGDRVEADHIDPGNPHSALAPAHRLCNQRKSNKPFI